MEDYYRERAEEYEKIYQRDDPVRLKEQEEIASAIQEVLKGKSVIEVAAGTGYWTQFLSKVAAQVVVTDYVEEPLELAKEKDYECPVKFQREDAYDLSFSDNSFSGGMANLWLSHVPRERIDEFLGEFHRVLEDGAMVFMADDNFREGVGGEFVDPEGDSDTYKIRELEDGSEYKVLKNYYTKRELVELFSRFSDSSSESIFYGEKFWYVYYELGK